MLTEYIEAAMRKAHYELMEDGRIFATIKPLKGLWADGDTLEECRENLLDTLEDWLFISIRERMTIPKVEGWKWKREQVGRVDIHVRQP